MTKLSEAQRRVLAAMAGGLVLMRIRGESVSVFLQPDGPNVHPSTFRVLFRRGLIHAWEGSIEVVKYRITEAGRAALQQSESVEGE